MNIRSRTTSAFTIVELLIVIVVIGILATITITSYGSIKGRANDSARLQSASQIRKALELYKAQNGEYPTAVANPGLSGWEASIDNGFLASLSTIGGKMPVDPINSTSHFFAYHLDAAGSYGCPASAGRFYVLRIVGLEKTNGQSVSDLSICSSSTTLSVSRTPSQTQAIYIGFEKG